MKIHAASNISQKQKVVKTKKNRQNRRKNEKKILGQEFKRKGLDETYFWRIIFNDFLRIVFFTKKNDNFFTNYRGSLLCTVLYHR